MLTAESVRCLLDIADVRKDPYAVARVAGELLDLDEQDRHAAAHYACALAVLGLGAAGRRVLRDPEKPLSDLMENTSAGLIPWTSRQRRFQANLRALADRGIPTAELLAAWELAVGQHELHQSRDGNFHVLDVRQPVWKGWLDGLDDHKAVTAAIPLDECKGTLVLPIAFDGVGHGWLLPHVLQATQRVYLNYSAAMYLVEPDVVALCMALHMHDLQEWLRSPQLRLYVGAGAMERLLHDMRTHANWTLPGRFVFNPLRERPALGLQPLVEALVLERDKRQKERMERMTAYYSQFDAAAWRKRFAEAANGGPPLRVLGITTRYSTVLRYSMEELQNAARAAGAVFEISMETDDQSREKNGLEMMERLKPDLMVMISRMRYEAPDLPRNVPALCWDQDNLQCMREPGALEDMKGLTFVAGHGAIMGVFHLGWPEGACIFCHAAGMTHRYRLAAGVAAEPSRVADFAYMSHASASPEQFRGSLARKWENPKQYLPLFNRACEEVLAGARAGKTWEFLELQELVRRTAGGGDVPPDIENMLMVDLRLLVDRVFRHVTLEWVSRWCERHGKTLRIWGQGWAAHPTLGKHAAGVALPGEDAQAVFRSSLVNLQIIETGVIHSRLLDGWAAGGFFLIRQAHRTEDEQRIRDTWRIAQLTREAGIRRIDEVEARGSEELRKLWATLAPEYAKWDKAAIFPGFRTWRCLPPATVLIPGVDQLMFNDEAQFGVLAERFLCGPEAAARREQASAGIQDVLQKHLSYDARWREFIEHIAANVGYAGVATR